jgi:hypothetical protein
MTWHWLLLSTTCACAAPQAALLHGAGATQAEAEEVQILRAQDATRVQREQRARPGPIADEDLTGKVLAIGGLRQVHLLEVTDGAERRVRFVTAFHADLPGASPTTRRNGALIGYYERPLEGTALEAAALGAPDRWMTVDHRILPFRVAECRIRWWFLESAAGQVVVSLDDKGHTAHVHHFPDGRSLAALEGTVDLLDARTSETGAELLVRTATALELVRVGPDGVHERRPLLAVTDPLAMVAAFTPRGPLAGDWVAVARAPRAERARPLPISVTILDLESKRIAEQQLAYAGAFHAHPDELRIASTQSDEGLCIALGDPNRGRVIRFSWTPERGVQQEQVLAISRPGLVIVTDRYTWSSPMSCDTGHALTFVPDVGGDGCADLLVASPTFPFIGRVDFVSSQTEAGALGRVDEDDSTDFGAGLSLDPTGTFVLVAGGETSMPENYAARSVARLVRIRDAEGRSLQTMAKWTLAAGGMRLPLVE